MIRIETVSRSFGDLLAVDRFSVTIEAGEIFGLLGPNGAGKSTLISMISGQLLPSGGSLSIGGLSPTSRDSRQRMGVAPQSLAMYEDLGSVANLEFFGSLYGLEGHRFRQRCEEVLEFVGLRERAHERVKNFSGGMKRRLNLAISLIHDPEVLLLDEPTVGVDPQSRNRLFENVLTLKKQGKTILYTTHYMEEAARLCDRVGIMEKGQLLALGTVGELIRRHGGESRLNYSTKDTETHIMTSNPIADIQQALSRHPDIFDLSLTRPDLEQVFLNLTGRQLRD